MQQQDVFDGTTQVFDALTGNHVFTYNAQNSGIVYAVAWSPVRFHLFLSWYDYASTMTQ